MDRDAYCRELEAYLCRKNDGHLIRIVGPAFERALSWAEQGIPLGVARSGIDRYFERYYRKGPRRRPVRLEFCEADILDAFDEWRRAVGISLVAADPEGGPPVEEPAPGPARARGALGSRLDGLLARLTVLRGSTRLGVLADAPLERAVRSLERLRAKADRARGDDRQMLLQEVADTGRVLVSSLLELLPADERAALAAEARQELEPFRMRMPEEAYTQALHTAIARLVRARHGLPDFAL